MTKTPREVRQDPIWKVVAKTIHDDRGIEAGGVATDVLDALSAAGFVIVPREPTGAMLAADMSPLLLLGDQNNLRVQAWRRALYFAMLAAAEEPDHAL